MKFARVLQLEWSFKMNSNVNQKILNRNLKIFFKEALKITLKRPAQAWSFLRTLFWLRKAGKIRESWKQKGYHIPPIIIHSITNECNLSCQGCYNKSFYSVEGKELSDEKLHRLTREAKELGVSFFVIAGGEPFLRPVLLEIMEKYPEIIFLVFTNGTLIDEVMIKRFRKQKNVVPMISLEGNRDETDKRRGEGTFEKLQQTMIRMKKSGLFFGISLTLVRSNFETITAEDFIKTCITTGCKFLIFLEYTPTQEGTENWVLTSSQRARVKTLMNKYRSSYPALFIAVPWDEDDVGGCLSAGRGFVHINAFGDLEPCPFAPFSDANLRDQSLKDALQSNLCKKIREVPELARETGGGCILWKERKRVASLLE